MNKKHVTKLSCNLSQVKDKSDLGGLNKPLTMEETYEMVEKSFYETKFATDRCYRELSKILFNFEITEQTSKPKDIFERMAEKDLME